LKTGLNDDLEVVRCVGRGTGLGGEVVAKIAKGAGLDKCKVFRCVGRGTGASLELVAVLAEGAGLNAARRDGGGRKVAAGKVDVAAWAGRRDTRLRESGGSEAALNNPVAGRLCKWPLLLLGTVAVVRSGVGAGEVPRVGGYMGRSAAGDLD
jgi:hypothetical protein